MPSDAPVAGKDRICLGVITAAFGVRGEVRIRPFTAQPGNIAAYGPLFTDAGGEFRIEAMHSHSTAGLVARLAGIGSREQAQALAGVRLYVSRAALPPPGEEEWYHADIIGLTAYGREGEEWGRVKAIWDFGAGDMLELERSVRPGKHAKGRRQSVMIPFSRENVASVQVDGGCIVMTDMAKRFEWQ